MKRGRRSQLATWLALAIVVTLTWAAAAAAASDPQLVGDLNLATPSPLPGWQPVPTPAQFASAGARAVFVVARSESSSLELWSTDGTPAGTHELAPLCASFDCFWAPPRVVAALAGRVYLNVLVDRTDGASRELWVTDGTAEGTLSLAGSVVDGPAGVGEFVLGSTLYFARWVRADGRPADLWATEGTVASTRRVATGLAPRGWVAVSDNQAYFFAAAGTGVGLWSLTASAPRPRLVRRFDPLDVGAIRLVGRRLYFLSGTEDEDQWLWTSDGTADGTARLARVGRCGDSNGCSAHFIGDDGRRLIFWSWRLMASDGTRAGTVALGPESGPWFSAGLLLRQRLLLQTILDYTHRRAELWTLAQGAPAPQPLGGCPAGCPVDLIGDLARIGDRALVLARTERGRLDLWVSDATGAGTRRIRVVGPLDDPVRRASAWAWGSRTLVAAGYAGHAELWLTDGTETGTRRLSSLGNYTEYGYGPPDVAAAGGRVIYAGYDPHLGVQPWASDGTGRGSGPLAIVEPQGAGSDPHGFTAAGDRVVFEACDGSAVGLWSSDGGVGSAVELVADRAGNCDFSRWGLPIASGRRAYFTRVDEAGEPGRRQLWTTDGTPGGTLQLSYLADATAGDALPLDDGVVFVVQPLRSGAAELWETDGTVGGTRRRFDFPAEIGDLQSITPLGSNFYFVARVGFGGLQIFASDGRHEGTWQLTQRGPQEVDPTENGFPFFPPRFARVGEDVFFAVCEAWGDLCAIVRSRGTPEATSHLLGDRRVLLASSSGFAAHQGRAYFLADGDLWSSDGTPDGTRVAVPLAPNVVVDGELTASDDALFFVASRALPGAQIWRSNGTVAGTRPQTEIPFLASCEPPSQLRAAGRQVVFSACDSPTGVEAWITDASAAGAVRLFDLAPGRSSSRPTELTPIDGRLWLAADDGLAGREPWVVDLDASARRSP